MDVYPHVISYPPTSSFLACSSLSLDYDMLVSVLTTKLSGTGDSPSPSSVNFERNFLKSKAKMAEHATKKKETSSSSTVPDWSELPGELVQVITEKMNNCFDVVHARSVCTTWRSTFPFPSCLLRSSYSLPTYPVEKEGLCSLEKIPFVLFRHPSRRLDTYYMGLVGRDESADYMETPSPLQCSVRVRMESFESTLINMNSCKISCLGHQYRMICWDPNGVRSHMHGAILPLNKEGGGFVVVRSYFRTLLMLTSAERKWVKILDDPYYSCTGLVSFRGRFYASFPNNIFVIHPCSLVPICMKPPEHMYGSYHLIPCGDDELFLVQKTARCSGMLSCMVCRLDEKSGEWVEVTDLGDRVLFVGENANVCCLAKDLPDGCGVTGNSVLFTNQQGTLTYLCKYGRPNFPKENLASEWRSSKESRVTFLKSQALAFMLSVKP